MSSQPDETTNEQELTRRLRLRGVSMRCPACEWTLDGPIGDYVLVPATEANGSQLGPGRVKLRVYACRNCGYVRLHSATVLRDV